MRVGWGGCRIGATTTPVYRRTSRIRNRAPLGPYSRTLHRALWWPKGGAVSFDRGTSVVGRGERGWGETVARFRTKYLRSMSSCISRLIVLSPPPATVPTEIGISLPKNQRQHRTRRICCLAHCACYWPRVSRSCEHFPDGFNRHLPTPLESAFG